MHTASAQSVITYDINNGRQGSYPTYFTAFKQRLYFVAFDSINGTELRSVDTGQLPRLEYDLAKGWSDGALSMTSRLDSNSTYGILAVVPRQMAVAKDGDGKELALYFYGSADLKKPAKPKQFALYKYDGITAPVAVITGIDAGYAELATLTDKVYFTIHTATGKDDLYEYNHSSNNYKKIHTGKTYVNALVRNLTAYKSKLFFSDGNEIWEYDPIIGKERMLIDYNSYGGLSDAEVIDGMLYYIYDGLYSYDGTNIIKIGQNVCISSLSSASGNLNVGFMELIGSYNKKVYFPCTKNPDCLLCEYDPVTKITTQLGVQTPSSFNVAQNKLFFRAYDTDHGYELWSYDGYKAIREVDVLPGKESGTAYSIVSFKNEIYFTGISSWGSNMELQKYVPKSAQSISNFIGTGFPGKVYVHPNPSYNDCVVSIELAATQILQLRIYNNMGQQVYALPAKSYTTGNSDINLPINQLLYGIYTLMLIDEKGKMLYNTRLVKR